MPWTALGICSPPASLFLHSWHLVPSSDTSQPLFSHPFFLIQDQKAAICSSILKIQHHWIMSCKSIWALKLCYSSAGEVFKPYTFRAVAIRWKEFCTESRMLPCFPTVRNKGPLSLASGSQKKREVGTNASCPVALKGTSGMSSERFNKQRKHTESQGAEVQGKKQNLGSSPRPGN